MSDKDKLVRRLIHFLPTALADQIAEEIVDSLWLAEHDAEKRAEWEAEQGWEYVPGWIAGDGRARISQGVVAPGYVGEFIAGGGEVVRRRVSRFETVTADMAPVEPGKTTKTEEKR